MFGGSLEEEGQICYKYKFEGAWPTASPTLSPTVREEEIRQFTDALLTITTTFDNLSSSRPIIPSLATTIDCYSDDFTIGFDRALQSVVANYLLQGQQELQVELISTNSTLRGPCQFESSVTLQDTELCLVGDCRNFVAPRTYT